MHKITPKTLKRFFNCLPFAFMAVGANAANSITVLPSGVLANKPIISEATFSKIARKNDLESISFNQHDLQKLDEKFNQVVATLAKEHVFEQIKSISAMYGVSPEAVAAVPPVGDHE